MMFRPGSTNLRVVMKEGKTMPISPRFALTLRGLLLVSMTVATLVAFPAASASADPQWAGADAIANTTAQPGQSLDYQVEFVNVGDTFTSGAPLVVHVALPSGLTAAGPGAARIRIPFFPQPPCTRNDGTPLQGGEDEFKCETTSPVFSIKQISGENRMSLFFTVAVSPSAVPGSRLNAMVSIEGGGAPSVSTIRPVEITSHPPAFGISTFDGLVGDVDGHASTQAGGHPDSVTTYLDFNTHTDPNPLRGNFSPVEATRDVLVDTPAGFIGNPNVADRCSLADLSHGVLIEVAPLCPPGSQVGTAVIHFNDPSNGFGVAYGPVSVFNMEPPPGAAARFGFNVLGNPVVLNASLLADQRIAITAPLLNEYLAIVGSKVTFWGNPSSGVHTPERSCPGKIAPYFSGPSCESERPEQPFLRMPTSCNSSGLKWEAQMDSWEHPGAVNASGEPDLSDAAWDVASYGSHESPGYPLPPGSSTFPPGYSGPTHWGSPVGVDDCGSVPFAPSFSAQPTTDVADSPSGLAVDLGVPQGCWAPAEVKSICQSDLKDAEVVLPRGISLNPSAATGLGTCSQTEIDLGTSRPQDCPNSSKLGAVSIQTPLLDHPVSGAVYLAQQAKNKFGSLLALYLALEDPQSGVMIKLAGKVTTDPQTGQLTTRFEQNPQLPFSQLHLEFFGGPRAALRTPPTCGTYTTEATLTPWSGNAPVSDSSSFQITNCPNSGFNPSLDAGTQNPLAGSFSPFGLRLSREDGTTELTGLNATLPEGLLGSLKGIAYCPDSTLSAISGEEGTGAAQIASPSCPATSQIGRVTVGAGAGPTPFFTQAGKAYLAGPYKGAPLSLAVVTPAVAGPFDLGNVVVRNALRIDPATTQLTAVSDPFPTILHGIPLDLRDVRVEANKPDFTINPTSCERKAIDATIAGAAGASARRTNRFQVGSCDRLSFKPKLSLALSGKTKRAGHPALRATLTMPPGGANIAKASVALPHSEFLDQAHIGTICTRVQYAAGGGGANSARPNPSTATPAPSARCSTSHWKARSTCAPRATSCPTSSPPLAVRSRSSSTAASTPSTAASAPPSKRSPTPRSPSSPSP